MEREGEGMCLGEKKTTERCALGISDARCWEAQHVDDTELVQIV